MAIVALPDDPEGGIVALFAREIPEIASGKVTIHALARAPGVRTKVAVDSNDPMVDPIAACVGDQASRIRKVVDALGGERIDVLSWSPIAERMIRHALVPMNVESVTLNPALGRAVVVLGRNSYPFIPNYGAEHRELASRLSGWDITIIDPHAA
jgi:transcription termination/antitermination protein NusA